jgi:hypothetical protein
MRCGKCGFENPEGMKFCGQCTNPLALICPKCRFENPPGFKFCGQCTAPLSALEVKAGPSVRMGETTADAEAIEGERKTVTALFADIKGSTELMRDLDPEEARAIVDPVLQLMMEAVHRYGGYVAQSPATASSHCSALPSLTRTTHSERCTPLSRCSRRSASTQLSTRRRVIPPSRRASG